MIAISLSPNTQKDDVILAFAVMLSPWRWFKGSAIKAIEDWFKRYFNSQFAISFDSGRSAEFAILQALNIKEGDEVLLQAFTCVAVPNSILWNGATPIYVDIDETGNIHPKDLEKKITSKSRAIIVQHTLGVVAQIEAIRKLAKKHKLILIEDCAHALGASASGKKIGTFGDFAFFSFGRDKIVSSVFGGMVITNSKKYAKHLRGYQRNLSYPSFFWIASQLFHPIAFAIILPFYNVLSLGKMLLIVLQKLRLLSFPVVAMEKEGKRPSFYPRKLPNAQAILATHQLQKLVKFNKHRQEIAQFYGKQLKELSIVLPKQHAGDIYLRYNVQVENPSSLYQFAKRRGILLGRWYSSLIDPKGVNLARVGYKAGSCREAQNLAEKSLNLPTHPRMNMKDAEKVVEVLKQYVETKHN